MNSQQNADFLLAVWQQNRDTPRERMAKLLDQYFAAPVSQYDETLARVEREMAGG